MMTPMLKSYSVSSFGATYATAALLCRLLSRSGIPEMRQQCWFSSLFSEERSIAARSV